MKNLKRSILSIVLILTLLVSSFVPSYASESGVLEYSSEYNSGERDVICTTLDGTSAASYYKNDSYDELSALSSSDLFTSLQSLMRTTHTYISSYDDCHYKADRTDCENEKGDGYIALIYTGYSASMSEWNGWNREHVWPKSLGGDSTTGGGADLHQIRPSDARVNSTRNNNKYGNTNGGSEVYGNNPATGYLGGYYANGYFEPLDNVKGDVARICLYMYVRWNSDWGADSITKVFQSVDVLLDWCELDPVDTWEMGRNEVVQDIQGNRNVFIDYPEYAWLLFGREVPDDMTTPSGEAMGESSGETTEPTVCQHTSTKTSTVAATCTVAGSITVTCTACGVIVSTSTIPVTEHSYVNGACSVCGLSQGGSSGGSAESGYSGTYYIATKRTSGNYWYMSNNLGTSSTKRYQAVDTGSTTLPESISKQEANSAYLFTLVKNSDGTYKIYADGVSGTSNYLGWSSGNSGALVASSSAKDVAVDYNSSTDTFSIYFTSGSETRYLSLNGTAGNNYFAWYKSGQKSDLTLIPVLSTQCSHTNTTITTTPAACTVAGEKIVTCVDCGEVISTEVLPANGHTPGAEASCSSDQACTVCQVVIVAALGHNYSGGTCTRCGVDDPNASCSHASTTVTDSATCTASGTKKVICNTCGALLSSETSPAKGHTPGAEADCENAQVCTVCQAVIVAALGHNHVGGVCTRCGDEKPEGFVLVTDVNDLVVGDQIIIVAKNSDYAISTTQKTNNRAQIAITRTNGVIAQVDGLQIITLEAGTVDGTFAFNVGNGYLYAASSSSNHLKTQTTNNANGSWKIEIAADGTATVKAQGTYTRNWLRYNSESSLFACYSSGQQDILIYKLPTNNDTTDSDFSGASLYAGTDLAIRYHVIPRADTSLSDYTVRFTMNGRELIANGVEVDGKYVFSFCGITPQCMGDVVKAELILDGEVIDTMEEYSVRQYVVGAFEHYSDDEALLNFLSDMLYYGAAAQNYRNYKTDALVTAGLEELLTPTNNSIDTDYDHKSIVTEGGYDKTKAEFTAAGVNFDYNNRIYIKFTTENIGNVAITVDGNALEIIDLGDNNYIAYSTGISALEFGKEVIFTLTYEGIVAQTLTYTVNDYVVAMANDAEIGELVNALYCYGASAEAYENSKNA